MSTTIAPAACVISIIIDAPAVSCTPNKQMDLQAFLLLQLPYCVSVLTSRCKSAAVQYKHVIIWHLHKVFLTKQI